MYLLNHHLSLLERTPTTVKLNLGETTPWEKQRMGKDKRVTWELMEVDLPKSPYSLIPLNRTLNQQSLLCRNEIKTKNEN